MVTGYFQAEKNANLTGNLTEIKKDLMFETQYGLQRGDLDRQEAHDRDMAQADLDIKTLTAQYQAGKDFESSPEYQTQYNQAMMQELDKHHDEIVQSIPELKGMTKEQVSQLISGSTEIAEGMERINRQTANYDNQIKLLETKISTATDSEKVQLQKQLSDVLAAKQTLGTTSQSMQAKMKALNSYRQELDKRWQKGVGAGMSFRDKYINDNNVMTEKRYVSELERLTKDRYTKGRKSQ